MLLLLYICYHILSVRCCWDVSVLCVVVHLFLCHIVWWSLHFQLLFQLFGDFHNVGFSYFTLYYEFKTRVYVDKSKTQCQCVYQTWCCGSGLDEKILQECVRFLDTILDSVPGARALETFYCGTGGRPCTSCLCWACREGNRGGGV